MLYLEVQIPFACFKDAYYREYARSYVVPPPSTVYGCLLSLVGEVDKSRHNKAEIAIATRNPNPQKSKILRRTYRFKNSDPLSTENSKPDFFEAITNVRLCLAVSSEAEKKSPNLEERIRQSLAGNVSRFGVLSMGESRNVINKLREIQHPPDGYFWLIPDEDGERSLTTSVDLVKYGQSQTAKFNLVSR